MVARIHYRWDFIGLSTDNKPTPETSEKVVDGSTYYCSDNSKLYVWYKTQWYERKPLGGGGGGGSYTAGTGIDITDDTISVDTTTIQAKLTAGDNITITDDTISATDTTYAAGSNITITNGEISATDTTYSNFTGTDGTAAGTAGLVPAPSTSDTDKYLKSDGSWATVSGGGGITELTSADYNYPVDNPTSIGLWLLEPGIYRWARDFASNVYVGANNTAQTWNACTAILSENINSNNKTILAIGDPNSLGGGAAKNLNAGALVARLNASGAASYVHSLSTDIVDNLTSSSATEVLSANQGKVLKDFIGDLTNLTTTDKTNLVAAINEAAAGGGGSGIVELTSADYNYPTNNPTSVALWLLPAGMYYAKDTVSIKTSSSTGRSGGLYNVAEVMSGVVVWYGIYSPTPSETVMLYGRTEVSTGNEQTSASKTVATLSDIYADPATMYKIKIGAGTSASEGNDAVEIGHNAAATGTSSVALGKTASASKLNAIAIGQNSLARGQESIAIGDGADTGNDITNSVALGSGAQCHYKGEVNIGSENSYQAGYNSSNYRLLTGLYDGQSAHDAATLAQGNTLATAAPTTATVGVLGQLYTDTTNMHTYQCTTIDTTDPQNPSYTWTQRW